MPEKTQAFRAKSAKKKGTTMALKASDVGGAEGMSTHRAKKKGGKRLGEVEFSDRSVSPRKPPGRGLTARSRKLPVPETGRSSTSRTKTLPAEAAAGYRKDGTRKKTTGRGDVTPLKASKKLTRPSRKTGMH
jgi:hypothetical protein